MLKRVRLPEIILFLSFIVIFTFLIVSRPSLPFLALLLIPIALGAVLYEFIGGTLVALTAMIGVALLAGLDGQHDPPTGRRPRDRSSHQ